MWKWNLEWLWEFFLRFTCYWFYIGLEFHYWKHYWTLSKRKYQIHHHWRSLWCSLCRFLSSFVSAGNDKFNWFRFFFLRNQYFYQSAIRAIQLDIDLCCTVYYLLEFILQTIFKWFKRKKIRGPSQWRVSTVLHLLGEI